MRFSQQHKIVQVLAPVADAYAAGSSDIVDMQHYRYCTFVALMGVAGGADRITFTVDACSNNVAGVTAQSNLYYRHGTGSTPDTLSALVYQTTPATGSTQLLAANCVATQHIIEVDAEDLELAGTTAATAFIATGCRLTWATSAAGGIVGGVLAILSMGRWSEDTMPSGLL